MQFDVIVMLIFLATLPQTLNVIFSMEIALRHHRFCDFKYSNLEWEWSNKYVDDLLLVAFTFFDVVKKNNHINVASHYH